MRGARRQQKIACFVFLSFAGLVVLAKSLNPIPSRTRPLNSSAPMVLWLKPWESRSLPGLPRTRKFLFACHNSKKPPPEWEAAFLWIVRQVARRRGRRERLHRPHAWTNGRADAPFMGRSFHSSYLILPVCLNRSASFRQEASMCAYVRSVVTALSVACLAGLSGLPLAGGALAQSQTSPPGQAAPLQLPVLKQLALTDKQIEAVIATQKEMNPITDKLPENACRSEDHRPTRGDRQE